MALNPGLMRQQVRIEQRSSTQNTAGEMQLVWTLFAERRASVETSPGRELWNLQQRLGRAPTIFRLRWLAGVLPAMRVLYDGQVYDIISAIDPDSLMVELVLTTELLVEEKP